MHRVGFPKSSVWVSGETGLMGLEVDPDFANNRRIYTCQGGFTGGGHDVHVTAWTLDDKLRKASKDKVLVGGFPTSSGRHGGCRLVVTSDGSLLVGTGDAAQGTNPQDLDSLGGKTLRLDRFSGAPWPSNPFANGSGPQALRAHLRPPQRPGRGRARRRHAVVDRAGQRPRRRGEPAHERRRLRLEPRARLQRVGPDDRPVPARQAASRHAGAPATRPSRPPAAGS